MNKELYIKNIQTQLSKNCNILTKWVENFQEITPHQKNIAFIEVNIDMDFWTPIPLSFHIIYLDNSVETLLEYEKHEQLEELYKGEGLFNNEVLDGHIDCDSEFILLNEVSKWFTKIWKLKTNILKQPVFVTTHDYMKWFDISTETWTDQPLENDDDGYWIK